MSQKIGMMIAILSMAGTLAAAELTGKWKFSVENDLGGKKSEPKIELLQKRNKVTGTYDGPYGKLPVSGAVRGMIFVLRVEAKGTNLEFRGRAEGSTKLQGLVGFSGDFSSHFTAARE